MPNVKLGTLTTDVAAAIREMRRGRLDFRCDRDGIVHAGVGKVGLCAIRGGERGETGREGGPVRVFVLERGGDRGWSSGIYVGIKARCAEGHSTGLVVHTC